MALSIESIFLPVPCIARRNTSLYCTKYGLHILLNIYLFCMFIYLFNLNLGPILSSIKSRPQVHQGSKLIKLNVTLCFETSNIFIDVTSFTQQIDNKIHIIHLKHSEKDQIGNSFHHQSRRPLV